MRDPRRRIPPPTVCCEGCDGAGWVRDLERVGSRCPRCGHDRFTNFVHFLPIASGPGVAGRRLVEPGMTGPVLIARRQGQSRLDRAWHAYD